MLFFICIIILFSIMVFLIVISEFKLEVKNLNISTLSQNFMQEGYLITIGLYIKKMPILKFDINKEKLQKLDVKEKIKRIDFNRYVNHKNIRKEILQRIKFWHLNLEEINLNIVLDTIDPIITSYFVALASSLIGILFGVLIKEYDKEKQRFLVKPVYINKNLITLSLSCIISIKIWNIIKEIFNHKKLYRHATV